MPEGTEMREQSYDIKNVSESALSPDTCLIPLLAGQQRIKLPLIFHTILEGLKDVHTAEFDSVGELLFRRVIHGGTWKYLKKSGFVVRIRGWIQNKGRHFFFDHFFERSVSHILTPFGFHTHSTRLTLFISHSPYLLIALFSC